MLLNLVIIGFLVNKVYTEKTLCPAPLRENITDGQRRGNKILKYGVTFSKQNYYVENNTTWGCVCNLKTCVRKCCGGSEIMIDTNCEEYPSQIQDKFKRTLHFNPNTTHLLHANNIYCPTGYVVHKTHKNDVLLMFRNGSILVNSIQKTLNPDMYCVDTFNDDMHKFDLAALICLEETDNGKKTNHCPEILRVDISGGKFAGGNISKHGVTFGKENYYNENGTLWGCICNQKTCVRKCCKENEIIMNKTCKAAVNYTQDDFKNVLLENNFLETTHHLLFSDGLFCDIDYNHIRVWDFDILTNGSIFAEDFALEPDKYCIETFTQDNVNYNVGALLCVTEDEEDLVDSNLHILGMIISMPFLLATFLVYLILPDSNLHRKALMSYVLTLLLAYIFLVTVQLYDGIFLPGMCQTLGFSVIFFFMVSFFWMNVMCIDMWFAFSGLRGFGRRHTERKRFLFYCLYAWGMPVLHVLIVFLLNEYGDQTKDYYPGVGKTKCFLEDKLPNLLYFYGPMAILITINIVLFILTAVKIQKVKKETSMLKHSDSKRHTYEDDKQKFNLYLKLLFAMGINWTMELISWAVIWKTGNQVPAYVWYLTDFCNAMYGAFIFFIFVFKKKIWKTLQKRYYVFMGKPHLAHSMTMTQTTRSSNYSTTETGLSDHRLSELRNGRGGDERVLTQH